MTDDRDTPYDPSIPLMTGTRMRDGGGTLARQFKAEAGKRRQRARQMRDCGDDPGAGRQEHDAAYIEHHADRYRDPLEAIGSPLATGIGGEVASADPARPTAYQAEVQQPPDMLAAEATEQRLTLTSKVSGTALTLGLEMAESSGARNAPERNLAHQIAVMHALGMTLAAQATSFAAGVKPWAPEARQQVQSIEAARMAREAARAFETSQRGMLALDRLQHGGQQVVTVQHVTVGEGGQAVVAGTVTRGDRRK